jgi:opacity protein-like surface antigen
MKHKLLYAVTALIIISSAMFAQNRFSIGLVGTRFENIGSEQKLTEIDVPFGYGVILGYAFNRDLTVAFTGEYFKNDMKSAIGKETDYRGHLSAYFMPIQSQLICPYLSAGFVYTNKNVNYTLTDSEETKGIFDARFGAGVDYSLIQNVSMNFDVGLYSDGLNIVGWSSSIGLRVNPRIF